MLEHNIDQRTRGGFFFDKKSDFLISDHQRPRARGVDESPCEITSMVSTHQTGIAGISTLYGSRSKSYRKIDSKKWK